MDIRHFHVEIPAPAEQVFSFLSQVKNLPLWATEFCQRLWQEDGHWRVQSPMGEVDFRIESYPATGVIDFHASPRPDGPECLPSRVIAIPGGSVYCVQFLRPPGMDDTTWEGQAQSLAREMENIRHCLA